MAGRADTAPAISRRILPSPIAISGISRRPSGRAGSVAAEIIPGTMAATAGGGSRAGSGISTTCPSIPIPAMCRTITPTTTATPRLVPTGTTASRRPAITPMCGTARRRGSPSRPDRRPVMAPDPVRKAMARAPDRVRKVMAPALRAVRATRDRVPTTSRLPALALAGRRRVPALAGRRQAVQAILRTSRQPALPIRDSRLRRRLTTRLLRAIMAPTDPTEGHSHEA